jgi:hypothetical protein
MAAIVSRLMGRTTMRSFVAIGLAILAVAGVLPSCVAAQSGADKSKTRASPAAKASGKWDRVLLDSERDYLAVLDGPEAKIGVGTSVDLLLDTGKRFNNVEVTEWLLGKGNATVRSVAVNNVEKKTKHRFQINAVTQITASDRLFDVVVDPAKKGYVLIDTARRDEVVAQRLRPQHRLWGESSDADQAKLVDEHKAYLKTVGAVFPQVTMTLSETDYFLFYTDIPLKQIGGYIAQLDAMYLELSKAFRVPQGKNIWRGKCVIVAFSDKAMFLRFEAEFMNNTNAEQAQGIHHGAGDGNVIISCWRGKDAAFFGHVLVHETSHGFMHRFRSTAHIPPWINEGVADWVAAVVASNCPETERRQRTALTEMQKTGRMGGNFFDDAARLERWQYGAASGLTHFMLAADPQRYVALITAIKEGYSPDESLKLAYGWSPSELVRRYGATIGLPNLQP